MNFKLPSRIMFVLASTSDPVIRPRYDNPQKGRNWDNRKKSGTVVDLSPRLLAVRAYKANFKGKKTTKKAKKKKQDIN